MRGRRALIAALVAAPAAVGAVACKDKPRPAAQPGSGSAAATPAPADAAPEDWTVRCEAVLRDAPKIPDTRRVKAVIDGCLPCGDWSPLLRWNTPEAEGGPPRLAIEAAMAACRGFCDAGAKQRFLGTLDDARGKDTRGPWRHLGESCGAGVSAEPDTRFMSAPYFALDRIARAAAAEPKLAPLLAGFDLALPAISLSGSGLVLASSPATRPTAGPHHLTISQKEVRIGVLPRARLGAAGVTVDAGGTPYPGDLVALPALRAELAKRAADPARPLALFAPNLMPAARLLDVIAAAAPHEVMLAVHAPGSPAGWVLAGTVPLALRTGKPDKGAATFALAADPDAAILALKALAPAELRERPPTIELRPDATVAGLAKLLGALGYFDVPAVTLVRAK